MAKLKNEPHVSTGAWPFQAATPCGAKTRKGNKCKSPAMKNGRCRLHGGPSTGPKTEEGLARSRRANWKHGWYSKESVELRRAMKLLREESQF